MKATAPRGASLSPAAEAGEPGGPCGPDGLRRAAARGALGWLLYALVHVAWNGLVVDETVVSAQVLNGAVAYPAGHPHLVFHLRALSLPNQLSALLWRLAPGFELVSGARNVLFLFLSAYTPYLVATLLTRRAGWGLVAAALALTDPVFHFKGVYPLFVFPTFYSHGHVGAYGALLVAALALVGVRRLGAVLLGLFPAVHPLLGGCLWGWGAWYLGCARARPRGAELRRFLGWAAAGAAGAAVSFAVALARVPPAPVPPYLPGADGALVRRAFLDFTDLHRQMPAWGSSTFLLGYVAGTLLFLAGAAVLIAAGSRGAREAERDGDRSADRDQDRSARALVALGLGAWTLVWGARALHALRGGLTEALETAMPNRLSNLSAILLVPLYVAALAALPRAASGRRRRGAELVALGLLLGAGAVAALRSTGRWVGAEYPAVPAYVLFAAVLAAGCGAALGAGARLLALVAAVALAAILAGQRRWLGPEPGRIVAGTGVVALGATLLLMRRERGAREERGADAPPSAWVLAAAVLCVLGTLRLRQAEEGSLVRPFDADLAGWLRQNAAPGELLLPPLLPRTQLQAKTGHPVLLELGTLWLMPYLPELSSVIGRLGADLYGVDYADRAGLQRLAPEGFLGQHSSVWRRAWERRGREEWRVLGQRYDLRLVLAPADWEVALEPELVGGEWVLYSIP